VRSIVASIVIGVGAFLLVAAALLRFYAPSRAEKTPLNLNINQVATGPATYGGEKVNLRATRHVRVDSTASDSKVVVVVESLCIVVDVDNPPSCVSNADAKKRLVSFSTDRVAADRRSAESVNNPKYGEYVNSDTSVKHHGLTYKWPFYPKKKTYDFYDPQSQHVAKAQYVRSEKVDGIDCYVYRADEKNLSVDVVPKVAGTYDDTRTVWIDTVTGTIVKGVEHQVRRVAASNAVALDTTLTFDKASIKYQAKQARDGRNKINLLTIWVPIIALVLGLAALAVGILLMRGGRGTGGGRNGGGARHGDGPPPDGDPNLADPDYEPTYSTGSSQT
jgi:hypothetical protein